MHWSGPEQLRFHRDWQHDRNRDLRSRRATYRLHRGHGGGYNHQHAAKTGFALFAALWLPIPGLILAGIGFGSKQPRRKRLFASLLLVGMLCAGVISQSACGGGSSSTPGGGNAFTPPGQYNVTVTATGGPVPQMATVSLTVQ